MIRVYIFSKLKMKSPLRTGGGDSYYTDLPVLRDSRGLPFISATALASLFRHSANPDKRKKIEKWLGYFEVNGQKSKTENEEQPEKKEKETSAIIFDDAMPIPDQRSALKSIREIRDQVAIERDGMTAAEGSKFTLEVVPEGTIFLFHCRCDISEKDERFGNLDEAADEMITEIKNFLAAGGKFGGKTRSGLGLWEATHIAIKKFDLNKAEDLSEWLLKGHGYEWDGKEDTLRDNLKNISWEKLKPAKADDKWTCSFKVEIVDGLHLSSGRSGLPIEEFPDQLQAKKSIIDIKGKIEQKYVDFGTSIQGRLRTTMEMLLRTYLVLTNNDKDGTSVNELVPTDPQKVSSNEEIKKFFGYAMERKKDKSGKSANRQGAKGIWEVEEHHWETVKDDVAEQVEPHIRLDQFTQHVINGALFIYAPLKEGATTVKIHLPPDAPLWQKQLIVNAVNLLKLNIIPWGGKASRGYLGAVIRDVDPKHFVVDESDENNLVSVIKRWCANQE